MNPLLEKLHDIEGLDPISAWPLAVGWWIVIALSFCLVALLVALIAWRISYKRSWRNDTFKKLTLLEQQLDDSTARETLMTLSEYLRRIALKRYPRKECAGLAGKAWLNWLTQNDPQQFDWGSKGVLLIEVPYAPSHVNLSVDHIKDLIHAVRTWVR